MGEPRTPERLEGADHTPWDGLVIGAGPAGAMVARELAVLGRRILLVERKQFPRWKICGACLNAHSLACLRQQAWDRLWSDKEESHSIRYKSVSRIAMLVWRCPKGQLFLDHVSTPPSSRQRLTPGLASCPRRRRRSAKFETDCDWCDSYIGGYHWKPWRALYWWPPVWEINASPRIPRPRPRSGPTPEIGAGCLLDDGPSFYHERTIFMAVGRKGYVGAVRVEDGTLNVAAALEPLWVRRTRRSRGCRGGDIA